MSAVTGNIKTVLRLEGLCILLASIYVYQNQEFSWLTFFVCFLIPDLSFFGYLINKKVGAIFYNAAHSLIGALLCLSLAFYLQNELMLIAGIIWCAHIGFDRCLGYGLKYSSSFEHTHLGLIGKARKDSQ